MSEPDICTNHFNAYLEVNNESNTKHTLTHKDECVGCAGEEGHRPKDLLHLFQYHLNHS